MKNSNSTATDPLIDSMFSVGAQYGYTKSRRHPSVKPYIFGIKNKVEIFDLEKTKDLLIKAKDFARKLGAEGRQILFVTSKNEALPIVKDAAMSINMPYVAGRWIGGTFTNFTAIRQRVDKLQGQREKRDKGELGKYTKKERLLIDREIEKMESMFSGIVSMKQLPGALFVVDPKQEIVSVTEARKASVPVIALLSTDCDMETADYPILGNDSSRDSIKFFVKEITESYNEGVRSGK
jgi:small subunit ribosomal protein S2